MVQLGQNGSKRLTVGRVGGWEQLLRGTHMEADWREEDGEVGQWRGQKVAVGTMSDPC